MNARRQEVIQALRELGGLARTLEIAEHLGCPNISVTNRLKRIPEDIVVPVEGHGPETLWELRT